MSQNGVDQLSPRCCRFAGSGAGRLHRAVDKSAAFREWLRLVFLSVAVWFRIFGTTPAANKDSKGQDQSFK